MDKYVNYRNMSLQAVLSFHYLLKNMIVFQSFLKGLNMDEQATRRIFYKHTNLTMNMIYMKEVIIAS